MLCHDNIGVVVASRGRGQVGFHLTPCVSQTENAHRATRLPRDTTYVQSALLLGPLLFSKNLPRLLEKRKRHPLFFLVLSFSAEICQGYWKKRKGQFHCINLLDSSWTDVENVSFCVEVVLSTSGRGGEAQIFFFFFFPGSPSLTGNAVAASSKAPTFLP